MAAVVAALAVLASAQRGHQAEADPVARLLEALRSSFVSGDGHFTSADGGCPENSSRWGWRSETRAGYAGLELSARGRQVGWVSDDHVYRDPSAAVGMAAQLAQRQGEPIPFTATTVGKRLNDAGLLDERDMKQSVLTIRKILSDARRSVWSLKAETLFLARENLTNLPTGALEVA